MNNINLQGMRITFTLLFSVVVLFSFYTSAQTETGTVTDFDGNVYKTVRIGNQWWMAENLRATHYYDGTAIPLSTATKTVTADDFKDYYMYPNNDETNVPSYGLLYSWSVIANQTATTMKKLLPEGWALPDTTAWAELSTYLGGKSVAGGKLKSTSVVWNTPNTNATDDYGFNAVPAGDCNTGGFTVFGQQARFWTPQMVDAGGSGRVYMILSYNSAALTKGQYRNVNATSLRYIKRITTALNSQIINQPVIQGTVVNNTLCINNLQTGSQLVIYSLRGLPVKKMLPESANSLNWDVSDLTRGIYFLSIQNLQNSVQFKFIKE